MATEIKHGRLYVDGQEVPLSMDEARIKRGGGLKIGPGVPSPEADRRNERANRAQAVLADMITEMDHERGNDDLEVGQ